MTAIASPPATSTGVAPRVVRGVWAGMLAALALAQLLYTFASRRPYTSGPSPLFGQPSSSLTDAVTAAMSALIVGAAAAMIALALPVARWPRAGGSSLVGAAAFGAVVAFSAWWNGATVSLGVLALPAIALAIGLFPRPRLDWFEAAVLLVLRVHVWASLAVALIVPSWALKQYGAASLPGVGTRLAGVTPHPNALGPVAVALLVLEWRRSPRSRLGVAVAAIVLLWTQSKTSWAAAVIIVGLGLVASVRRRTPRRSKVPALVLAVVLGLSAYVGLGVAGDSDVEDRTDTSTETFTGRTAIWEVTLEVWRQEPVLGAGPALWNDEMDARYAHRVGFAPGHAHNQLIQTLGQAGVVGAAALVAFLWSWAALARRADAAAGGAAGALFLVLIVRSFSEPPFQSTPYATSFLLTVVALAYALVAADDVPADG